MGDVLLVVCGGGANATVRNAEDLIRTPMVIISNSEATVPLDDEQSLMNTMKRYRVVIPFCVLGGELSTDKIRTVVRCARENGCKVVPVLGLPFEWEIERRQRAMDNLSDVVALSDCSLVFDLQKITDLYMSNQSRKVDESIKMANRLVMMSMNAVIDCIEGPFFSTFSRKLYAFASNSAVLPTDAIKDAWGMMLFDKEPSDQNSVILVGSKVTSAEIEDIKSSVAMTCGAVPEVMRRRDGDSRVDVFKPVKSF